MDCAECRRVLREIRQNRRSQSPGDLARAADLLGYKVDKYRRGKGSHWMAIDGPGPRFPIPTTKDPGRVGTVTTILVILEEVVDRVCPDP